MLVVVSVVYMFTCSLLFRSCIHVRATCFVVVSVMYTC